MYFVFSFEISQRHTEDFIALPHLVIPVLSNLSPFATCDDKKVICVNRQLFWIGFLMANTLQIHQILTKVVTAKPLLTQLLVNVVTVRMWMDTIVSDGARLIYSIFKFFPTFLILLKKSLSWTYISTRRIFTKFTLKKGAGSAFHNPNYLVEKRCARCF